MKENAMSRTGNILWCLAPPARPTRLESAGRDRLYCPACGARFSLATVRAWPSLFAEPDALTRPGYDPVTGFEAQDLPG